MPTDLAMRFPSETPMEVYTPNNPPPPAVDFLKLDQTTPQTVSNGSPEFAGGITIKAGQKLIFDGA